MSSGACRALVAVLLTLSASVVTVVPVAAESERLNEASTVTYTVNPRNGNISVDMNFVLRAANPNRAVPGGRWGPIYVEELSQPRISGATEAGFSEAPGPWREMYVDLDRIPPGEPVNFRVRYRLPARLNLDDTRLAQTPARVSDGYIYVCVPGQDTDSGSTTLEIGSGSSFSISQSGNVLEESSAGLTSGDVQRPVDLFTCIEATREGQLDSAGFIGPDDREIVLQAWPGEEGWLFAAEDNAEPTLDAIREFLGHAIPGDGPVVIRQAPPRTLAGYASDHDTPGVVQVDERGGVIDPEHELAHAWFSTDNFIELWLREGLAEWTARSMRGEPCAPVERNDADVELADWKVVQPSSNPDTISDQIEAQEEAACGLVAAMASRMDEEQWRTVLGALIKGETKYIGSSGPDVAATPIVSYRQWLDAVDERGLVPAAERDPAYAANLEDLDFAQDLVEAFGADVEPLELAARSEARAYYHRFLDDAAPLGAPLAVRKAMEDWNFRTATQMLDKSYEVLTALQEATALLPDADIFPIIAPDFEAAPDAASIDAVLEETLVLLESATEVFGPLAELREATPAGWDLPNAVNDAIAERRFDDIMKSISPALTIVRDLQVADASLPQAGLLAAYKTIYETTTTPGRLEDLAEDTAAIRTVAEQTGIALDLLQNEVGEWQIPDAVTEPIDNGQLTAGLNIVTDARAVVAAARAAELALPRAELAADIRPRFEAVTSGGEMASLKVDAEEKRDQAQSIGGALSALEQRVPDWQIPDVITRPIEERDFEVAAEVASEAQHWIEDAWVAEGLLPELDAIERAKVDFEAAESLADLQSGAARAENWTILASRVAEAKVKAGEERDLLANLGLMGVDVDGPLSEALDAAREGDVQTALDRSATVIDIINSAQSSGGLRLAGIVFLGVALAGVLGLWLVLRREAGPPWARQTTPHWVKKRGSRWRRGK